MDKSCIIKRAAIPLKGSRRNDVLALVRLVFSCTSKLEIPTAESAILGDPRC